LAVFLGLLAVPNAASSAQMVVLDASGAAPATLAPGSVIDDAALDVPAGATVMIMGADGEAVKIIGPHKGPVGDPQNKETTAGNAVRALSALIGDHERTTSFGATRDGGSEIKRAEDPEPRNPYVVNATQGGTSCIFRGHPASLWKPASNIEVQITVENVVTHDRTLVDWPANAERVPWPSDVRAVDGQAYKIWLTPDSSRQITLKFLPATKSDGEAALAAAAAKCTDQSLILAHKVKPARTIQPQ